jgi:hypothetical protein
VPAQPASAFSALSPAHPSIPSPPNLDRVALLRFVFCLMRRPGSRLQSFRSLCDAAEYRGSRPPSAGCAVRTARHYRRIYRGRLEYALPSPTDDSGLTVHFLPQNYEPVSSSKMNTLRCSRAWAHWRYDDVTPGYESLRKLTMVRMMTDYGLQNGQWLHCPGREPCAGAGG